MSKEIKNSIWPNGMGIDSDGYAVFYPMGTNKVEIPKNSPHWPKGNKLKGSFVYDKDNKLVGFCDTNAMTSKNSGEIVVMPYEHIDTEFDSIPSGSIQIHAPKAVVKKASWTGSVGKIDIPDVQYKYKGCKYVGDIKAKDENYLENDIVDGKWTELLSDLGDGNNMFLENENITSFTSDLSSLTSAYKMFNSCPNLTSFDSDLSSLTYGYQTFTFCSNLTSIESDLSSVDNGFQMFFGCSGLTTFEFDLPSLTTAQYMFSNCSNMTVFKSNLKSLVDGQFMFQNCSNLTSFDSDLSSLTNCYRMFHGCSNLSSFRCQNLNSLAHGDGMFTGCNSFSQFDVDISSINTAAGMFNYCSNLTSFSSELNSLVEGNSMFESCSKLLTFKCSDLSSLTNGHRMFYGCPIQSFSVKLKSLTNGNFMFHSCSNLTTFDSDLSSLTNGNRMFNGCSLTRFNATLCSITDGDVMFGGCRLNASSIKNIIDTINTVESANLTLGMGCDNNVTDKDLFAQEVGYSDMSTLLTALQNKGWTISAQYNGRPSTTFSLRKPDSLPVYVKLVEVIPSEDDDYTHYEYTSQDGFKFYNLDWFHETTGSTEDYETFQSLEEAITTFNIKPIEK